MTETAKPPRTDASGGGSSPQEGAKPPPERRWRLLLSGAVVALVGIHYVLSRSMDGFLLADGSGYLANARWIVGKAGSTWQGPAAFYSAGWSLVVAPVYLFTSSPGAVHAGVLFVNAMLASASVVAYAALAHHAFGASRRVALLAGLVAATYPAVLLQASFEWSESLFHLLFPVLLLAAWRMVRTGSIPSAIVTGVAAAALNATHPKGLGAVGAVGIAFVVLGSRRLLPRRAAAAGLASLLLAVVATRLLHGALQDALYDKSAVAIEGDLFGRVTDPALVWGSFQRLWGQLWYLTVASVGLFPLGVVHVLRHRDRRFAGIMLGTALAMLAASCLQMSDGTRVDHMIYGRYDEGFLPAFLVAGAVTLVAHRRHVVRLAAAAGGLSIVLAGLALLFNGPHRFSGNVMPLNVVGVLVYRTHVNEVSVGMVTLLALVPLVAIAVAARWSPLLGLGVLVMFFVGSSLSVEARTLRPWEDFWSSVTEIPAVVHEIGFHGPIGYDLATYKVDAADLYQLELTDVGALLFFDSRTSEHLPGTDLVIAGPKWDQPGARLLFVETGPYPQALWVLPGNLQQRLDGEGLLVPAPYSAPIPSDGQRAVLDVEPEGDRFAVHVRDDGATWLPAGKIPGVVTGTVRVGARWYVDGAEVASKTAELPRMLRPGDQADIVIPFPDIEPGTYRVVVSLRQESIAWWDASAVELTVTVQR